MLVQGTFFASVLAFISVSLMLSPFFAKSSPAKRYWNAVIGMCVDVVALAIMLSVGTAGQLTETTMWWSKQGALGIVIAVGVALAVALPVYALLLLIEIYSLSKVEAAEVHKPEAPQAKPAS